MRTITSGLITKTIKELCIRANIHLRTDIFTALKLARKKETSPKARRVLDIIIENKRVAEHKKLPICQDTGMVVLYLKIGQDVKIRGDIKKAIEKGVARAYREGYFRKSIVRDPLIRKNTNTNLPPVIYTRIVPGKKIDIRAAIKGFGSENVARTRMFRPTDSPSRIKKFIVETVREVGPQACPPLYIGVGIGGTIDKAVALSKEAVFRPIGRFNKASHIAGLEKAIFKEVNRLKIGPMGVGGRTTALGVSILTYPTHIAGLPVAINISCHATRDARRVI